MCYRFICKTSEFAVSPSVFMSVHDVKILINRDGSEETASLMGAFKYAVSYMANRYNETVKGEDFHGLSGFLIHLLQKFSI